MFLCGSWICILCLSTFCGKVTSQFLNLPETVVIPENLPDGAVIYAILFSREFFPGFETDFMTEYDPLEARDIFTVLNTDHGFDVVVSNSILLDYETTPTQYRISLIDMGVTEGSGELELPFLSKRQAERGGAINVLTINITDVNEPPRFDFDRQYMALNERQGPVESFISLSSPALDEDANDAISYEIVSIFPAVIPGVLAINDATGTIKLLSDYDVDNNVHPDVLLITIAAVDTAGLSSTALLVVNVQDVNDNAPVFTENGNYVMVLPFDYAGVIGVRIGYVHADDRDAEDIGGVTYAMATPTSYFLVASTTGIITLASAVPVETSQAGIYSFSIIAYDKLRSGEENIQTSSTASVTVYIVPFCTEAEEQTGCDVCATLNTSSAQSQLPALPLEDDGVFTGSGDEPIIEGPAMFISCPRTTCSRCHDYISSTCQSGTASLTPSEATAAQSAASCPSAQSVAAADTAACVAVPTVMGGAMASSILGYLLYRRKCGQPSAKVGDIPSNSPGV